MKDVYLLIETGYEGIERLCYVTKSPKIAIVQKKKFQEEAIKKKIERNKDANKYWKKEGKRMFLEPETLTEEQKQSIRNFFCIQKWNGKDFECACKELKVEPSEMMLR